MEKNAIEIKRCDKRESVGEFVKIRNGVNFMKTYVYRGGLSIVGKSGVGKAIEHQEKMLSAMHASHVDKWKDATVVHIFKNSFIGSNLAAPLFKKWICFCYNLGDVIVTPTEYSQKLLAGYGLKRKIYSITNGVDTEFFKPDLEAGKRFREKYHLAANQKVVISVGHLIQRKGILEFLELAKKMPDVQFIWFGGGNESLMTAEVKEAIQNKSENVFFAGFVEAEELRDAYCGADAFVFMSHEETEGIVVLEAFACEIPTIVRDIPVYGEWLENGKQVFKANAIDEFQEKLAEVFCQDVSEVKKAERKTACDKSLEKVGERLQRLYFEVEKGE